MLGSGVGEGVAAAGDGAAVHGDGAAVHGVAGAVHELDGDAGGLLLGEDHGVGGGGAHAGHGDLGAGVGVGAVVGLDLLTVLQPAGHHIALGGLGGEDHGLVDVDHVAAGEGAAVGVLTGDGALAGGAVEGQGVIGLGEVDLDGGVVGEGEGVLGGAVQLGLLGAVDQPLLNAEAGVGAGGHGNGGAHGQQSAALHGEGSAGVGAVGVLHGGGIADADVAVGVSGGIHADAALLQIEGTGLEDDVVLLLQVGAVGGDGSVDAVVALGLGVDGVTGQRVGQQAAVGGQQAGHAGLQLGAADVGAVAQAGAGVSGDDGQGAGGHGHITGGGVSAAADGVGGGNGVGAALGGGEGVAVDHAGDGAAVLLDGVGHTGGQDRGAAGGDQGGSQGQAVTVGHGAAGHGQDGGVGAGIDDRGAAAAGEVGRISVVSGGDGVDAGILEHMGGGPLAVGTLGGGDGGDGAGGHILQQEGDLAGDIVGGHGGGEGHGVTGVLGGGVAGDHGLGGGLQDGHQVVGLVVRAVHGDVGRLGVQGDLAVDVHGLLHGVLAFALGVGEGAGDGVVDGLVVGGFVLFIVGFDHGGVDVLALADGVTGGGSQTGAGLGLVVGGGQSHGLEGGGAGGDDLLGALGKDVVDGVLGAAGLGGVVLAVTEPDVGSGVGVAVVGGGLCRGQLAGDFGPQDDLLGLGGDGDVGSGDGTAAAHGDTVHGQSQGGGAGGLGHGQGGAAGVEVVGTLADAAAVLGAVLVGGDAGHGQGGGVAAGAHPLAGGVLVLPLVVDGSGALGVDAHLEGGIVTQGGGGVLGLGQDLEAVIGRGQGGGGEGIGVQTAHAVSVAGVHAEVVGGAGGQALDGVVDHAVVLGDGGGDGGQGQPLLLVTADVHLVHGGVGADQPFQGDGGSGDLADGHLLGQRGGLLHVGGLVTHNDDLLAVQGGLGDTELPVEAVAGNAGGQVVNGAGVGHAAHLAVDAAAGHGQALDDTGSGLIAEQAAAEAELQVLLNADGETVLGGVGNALADGGQRAGVGTGVGQQLGAADAGPFALGGVLVRGGIAGSAGEDVAADGLQTLGDRSDGVIGLHGDDDGGGSQGLLDDHGADLSVGVSGLVVVAVVGDGVHDHVVVTGVAGILHAGLHLGGAHVLVAAGKRQFQLEVGSGAGLDFDVHIGTQGGLHAGGAAGAGTEGGTVGGGAVVQVVVIGIRHVGEVGGGLEDGLDLGLGVVALGGQPFQGDAVVVHVGSGDGHVDGGAGLVRAVQVAAALVDDTFALGADGAVFEILGHIAHVVPVEVGAVFLAAQDGDDLLGTLVVVVEVADHHVGDPVVALAGGLVGIVLLVLDGVQILAGAGEGIVEVGEQLGEEQQTGGVGAVAVQVGDGHGHGGEVAVGAVAGVGVGQHLAVVVLIQSGGVGLTDGVAVGTVVVLHHDEGALVPAGIVAAIGGGVAQTAADDQFHQTVAVQIADGGVGGLKDAGLGGVALGDVCQQGNGHLLLELALHHAVDVGVGVLAVGVFVGVLGHGHGDDQVIGVVLLQVAGGQGDDGGALHAVGVVVGIQVAGDVGVHQQILGLDKGEVVQLVVLDGAHFDHIGAVVEGQIVLTVAVEVAGGDVEQRVKGLVVDGAGLVQGGDVAGQGVSADDGLLTVHKLDQLHLGLGLVALAAGGHVQLRHAVQLAAGTAVSHGGLVSAGQVAVVAGDAGAEGVAAQLTVGVAVTCAQIGPVAVAVLAVTLVRTDGLIAGPAEVVQIQVVTQNPAVVAGGVVVEVQLVLGVQGGVARADVGLGSGSEIGHEAQSLIGALVHGLLAAGFRGLGGGHKTAGHETDQHGRSQHKADEAFLDGFCCHSGSSFLFSPADKKAPRRPERLLSGLNTGWIGN